MLRIDRGGQSLIALESPSLADCSITERYDLQEYITNSPAIFFQEIGQDLFLLGKEVVASTNVQDRIDILALDKSGAVVIVELKRGNHKLHMLQAISYAGMMAEWSPSDLLELLDEAKQEELADFLEVDTDEINRHQKIILLAEAYDFALLVAAKWLSEKFGVELTCCRLAIARDQSTASEYLVCSNVHPPPELAEQAVPRGRKAGAGSSTKWSDWDAALEDVNNSALVDFYKKELAAGNDHYLLKRILRYRSGGKRRWNVAARRKHAYVWQQGRFPGDVDFWHDLLGEPAAVEPVKEGQCLRLFLTTAADFRAFRDAVADGLQSANWIATPDEADPDSELEEP